MKRYCLLLSLLFLLSGCAVNDLYHALDQFEYLVTLADLANATINADFEVNWDALYRLSQKYGVDVSGPAADYLVAAQNLQLALQQLQNAIERHYQTDIETQALRKTLRGIDLTP